MTDAPTPLECSAFPHAVRRLAMLLMAGLAVGAAVTSTDLRSVDWHTHSVVLFLLAYLCIAWMGYWILHSRTRLAGGELTQTWLWTKRAHVRDVASMKLVHWAWVDALIAPRLLVRQKSGGISWFHAADATVLREFMAQVVQQQTRG